MSTTTLKTKIRQTPRLWWLMTLLALAIAAYGMSYVILRERMFNGDLAPSLRARPWAIFFHALFASIALAVGPFQFHRGLLMRFTTVHRTLGKVYVVSAILGSGLIGLYMSFYSFGGLVTHFGFGLLALLTGTTTAVAYVRIRNGEVKQHREWMIRSYSMLFGAVTLRLWLPLLIMANGGKFAPAYMLVAWLSWVPNLLVAEWWLRRENEREF